MTGAHPSWGCPNAAVGLDRIRTALKRSVALPTGATFAELGWQRVDGVSDEPLEVWPRVLRIAVLHTRKPSPARMEAARC
jgi:hypothetical protein